LFVDTARLRPQRLRPLATDGKHIRSPEEAAARLDILSGPATGRAGFPVGAQNMSSGLQHSRGTRSKVRLCRGRRVRFKDTALISKTEVLFSVDEALVYMCSLRVDSVPDKRLLLSTTAVQDSAVGSIIDAIILSIDLVPTAT